MGDRRVRPQRRSKGATSDAEPGRCLFRVHHGAFRDRCGRSFLHPASCAGDRFRPNALSAGAEMKAGWSRLASSSGVHPLLFASFPVLFVWSHNLDQGVTHLQGLTALAAAMSFSVVVFCLLRLFLKDWSRSAVAASVIVILFLTLGRMEPCWALEVDPLKSSSWPSCSSSAWCPSSRFGRSVHPRLLRER